MAAPVIDGIDPPGTLDFSPGQTRSIRVLAHDPDNGPPVTVTLQVADSTGNVTPLSLTAQVSDPLTYLADTPPAGWAVTQDAADPARFHITAP